MAVASTPNLGSGVLNVASIVSGLMTVEQQPLTRLDAKIGTVSSKISMLGTFLAKASALQSAANSVSSATAFSGRTATSSSTALITATAGTSAAVGELAVSVVQSAAAQTTTLTGGFTSATAAVPGGGFVLNGHTFATSINTMVVGGVTRSFNSDTLTSLAAQINAHNDADPSFGIKAAVIQKAPNNWGLVLTGATTGAGNGFSVPVSIGTGPALTNDTVVAADAILRLNGVEYTRPNNTFDNVLPGVSLTINQAVTAPSASTSATVVVASKGSSAVTAVQTLATAYNDLWAQYQSLTRSGADASTRGPLNGDGAIQSFMGSVIGLFNAGLYDSTGNQASWSTSGVTFQRDGTLSVDAAALTASMNDKLGTVLSNGNLEKIGTMLPNGLYVGASSSVNGLSSFISTALLSNGVLGSDSAGRKTELASLNTSRTKLSAKLTAKQASYTAQYARLDAQLTTMQQTSTALAGALAGLMGSTSTK